MDNGFIWKLNYMEIGITIVVNQSNFLIMKTFFSTLTIATVVLSCNSSAIKSNAIREFMPGAYVRHTSHEMGEEWDTLRISPSGEIGNDYIIQRGWAYQRISDGVKQPVDYKTEKRKAIFDEQTMVLTETKSGRVISFVPEKNILLSETREYEKLKD